MPSAPMHINQINFPVEPPSSTNTHFSVNKDEIRDAIGPITDIKAIKHNPILDHYFEHYRFLPLKFIGRHRIGTFESNGYSLVGHLFIQNKSANTVIIMHGLYDHAGQLAHLVHFLLASYFNVAIYDMPGHGLSSGPEVSINSFHTYGAILSDFCKIVQRYTDGNLNVIAHSTGAVAPLDMLLIGNQDPFKHVIVIAPLIRSVKWHLSKIIYLLTKQFIYKVPRRLINQPDKYLLDAHGHYIDPLQYKHVNLQWVKALFNWDKVFSKTTPIDRKITIIQGNDDTTVDVQYNLKKLAQKFRNNHTIQINTGPHELLSQYTKTYHEVYAHILTTFGRQPDAVAADNILSPSQANVSQ